MTHDLKSMIETMSDYAEKCISEYGYVSPIWIAETRSGSPLIFPPPPYDRETGAKLVRTVLAESDVVACTFIDEAWYAVCDGTNVKTAAEHPDRVEVVAITAETEFGGQLIAWREIIRKARCKPTLGPLTYESSKALTGLMVGMLQRSNQTMH